MSDLTLNRYLASGTSTERQAFTPNPGTPASGPDLGVVWFETDTGLFYGWDGSAWVQVAGEIQAPPPASPSQNTFLLSGGQVTWSTGYTFRVSAAEYYINAVRYSSAEQTIALDAADATNNRFDVIALDTSGTVQKITGTASSTPSEPSVDPAAYVKLAIVLVTASSSSPSAVSSVTVYTENGGGAGGEWNWATSGSGFNVASTNNPHAGTKDIEGTTVAAAAYAQGDKPSGTIDPNAYDFLLLFIRSKATWNNSRGLLVTLRSSGVLVGASVQIRRSGTYGFDSSLTSDYQQVAIPLTAFAIPKGSTINQVRIEDFGGSIGFYIDDISFQVGGSTPATGGITQSQADARYEALGNVRGTAPVDDGNSGTSKTIDFSSYRWGRHELTLTGNVTLTLSNPADLGVYYLLIHTGAGSFTVTWPASVLWPGGVAPVITATASKTDLIVLVWDNSAGKYYGSFNQNYNA